MKIISPKLHGIIDYLIVLFLYASPTTFVLPTDIANYTYILATTHLILTVVTNYSFGIFRFVPLPLHGLIELVVSVALIVSSYTVFRYDERARPFFLGFGVFLLIVFIFTDYNKKHDKITTPIL